MSKLVIFSTCHRGSMTPIFGFQISSSPCYRERPAVKCGNENFVLETDGRNILAPLVCRLGRQSHQRIGNLNWLLIDKNGVAQMDFSSVS